MTPDETIAHLRDDLARERERADLHSRQVANLKKKLIMADERAELCKGEFVFEKTRADALEKELADSRKNASDIMAANDRQISVIQKQRAELESAESRLAAMQDENTRLRAALATSKDPCVYCQLPKEEMGKCKSGFPGCGRADDLMGCPELGASQRLAAMQKHADALAVALEEARVQMNHLEDLRRLGVGPTPATLTPDIVSFASKCIAAYRAFTAEREKEKK